MNELKVSLIFFVGLLHSFCPQCLTVVLAEVLLLGMYEHPQHLLVLPSLGPSLVSWFQLR